MQAECEHTSGNARPAACDRRPIQIQPGNFETTPQFLFRQKRFRYCVGKLLRRKIETAGNVSGATTSPNFRRSSVEASFGARINDLFLATLNYLEYVILVSYHFGIKCRLELTRRSRRLAGFSASTFRLPL